MADTVAYIIALRDQYSSVAKNLNRTFTIMEKKVNMVNKRMKRFEAIGKGMSTFGKTWMTNVSLPIIAGLGMMVNSAAKLETMRTAFVGILGSAEKAKDMVATLNEFTAKTPFQLDQVASSAKKLLAASVAPEAMAKKLQVLGDISAAANVPLSDMSSIFAKIKNKGKAMTEEILQMSDRGIPIIKVLAKQYGVLEGQIFEMASKGKISFKDIEKAMVTMTTGTGFASNAMILQSKTLSGVWSTFKDNLMLTSAALGETLLPTVKEFLSNTIKVLQKVNTWVKNNKALTKGIIKFALALAMIGPVILILGKLISMFFAVRKAIKLITFAMKLLNITMSFNPWVLGIMLVVGAVILLVKYWKQVKAVVVGVVKSLGAFFTMIKEKVIGFLIEMLDKLSKLPIVGKKIASMRDALASSNISGSKDMANAPKPASSSVDISGKISVMADKGSKITGASSFNPNVGLNAAPGNT